MSEIPKMLTIREVVKTGILSERALRLLVKQGKIPALFIGTKALLDLNAVVEYTRILAEQNLKEVNSK
jgi:hypothetical protein